MTDMETTELCRLQEEVERMRMALKPFADMYADLPKSTHHGVSVIHKLGAARAVTVGDLRRARDAYERRTP